MKMKPKMTTEQKARMSSAKPKTGKKFPWDKKKRKARGPKV